jgi:hypothetical protein
MCEGAYQQDLVSSRRARVSVGDRMPRQFQGSPRPCGLMYQRVAIKDDHFAATLIRSPRLA